MHRHLSRSSVAAMMARQATPAEAMLIKRELLGLYVVKAPRRFPDGEGRA